jgi:hypothetical protein
MKTPPAGRASPSTNIRSTFAPGYAAHTFGRPFLISLPEVPPAGQGN